MNKNAFTLLVLLVLCACNPYVVTPTASPVATATPQITQTASPAPEATQAQTAQVLAASVVVRQSADGEPTGQYIYAGQEVIIIECDGDWCEISEPVTGFVFMGCLSVESDLGCEAK